MNKRAYLACSPRTELMKIFSNGLLILFIVLLTASSAISASNGITLTGRTISGSKAKVSCSLTSSVASRSRLIQIGRAFNSTAYKVIAKTSRRVRTLSVITNLSSSGHYRFICRVTLRNGKYLWSNTLSADVSYPTPQPTTAPTQIPELRSCPSSYTSSVLNLVNQSRAGYGLGALTYNYQLESSAQGHTNWMAVAQNLTHGTTDEMVQRIRDAGFSGSPIGENIAWGQSSPSQVMEAWLNSPPHRANILDSRYHYLGVGCVLDRYGKYWWTQNFGG
ncbi:MAG: CAP domain-containing protein [SAR324 cluster bacterium]|uniref:CAP domain-containing protein n=1 Tax=SAR324 cluster bacterium TaxID=2024889 RepID=A0A7X9FSN2_9DELT|nr:CAP domain-containing protein [SAR324 cluster bacterium]